ncbi:carbohydrate sulfotransferase 11-like isoform X2 [Eriocheir sinensis]|uniref:carbohydrate sulfotransferase 11-like isoform X2 n=1 Tax=Eriocheir sinensis TaxID=95602 RepID=UPI0021C9FE86|nr:carbohydrate sulfotransferase 11-like isoform X2 [Eriocheir sinensis]
MSTARLLACMAMAVAVIWYGSGIQHQLLPPPLQSAATDTPTHRHALGGDPRASTPQPAPTQGNPTARPPKNDPTHDSANTTAQSHPREGWETVVRGRLARVAEVCRKHPRDLMRFDIYGVYKSLTVDPTHHIIYCRNAKAGTTSWLSRLLTWAGISLTNTSINNIHKVADRIFPMVEQSKMMEQLRRSAVAFTVARHPFDRLVSAYRNKIQGDENYKTYLWPDMIRKYRKGVNNGTVLDGSIPTFREFALFASDEVLRCLGRARPSCLQMIDVHWQPHHDRCAPCNIKYDVIAKMETKDEDEAYLSHLLGQPLPEPTKQNAASGNSTSSLTKSFFATLSRSERQQVFEAYKYDFLMFGYSYNDEDFA